MAKKPKPAPLPLEALPLVKDILGFMQSAPVAKVLLEGNPIENLELLRRSHSKALFKWIEGLPIAHDERDRGMDLASTAVVGGMLAEALQKGVRVSEANHETAKYAREERAKTAPAWKPRADVLAAEKWAVNQRLSPNDVAELITPKLQEEFRIKRQVDTVRRYLSKKKKVGNSG
jgi:hypothetical protein